MSNTTNSTVAKLAAITAGFAMVALSVMPGAAFAQTSTTTNAQLQAQIQALLAQIAALQAQLSGQTTITFTRNLTLGSSGADVTRLQTFLISKGFSIPAGATGYFGNQTKAALAAFQAANSIAPAVGYFGPLTRARVSAMIVVVPTTPTTPTTPTNPTTPLQGGEARLTDFELVAESGTVREGGDDIRLATARFDVEDADVRVERVDLEFQAVNASLDVRPWRYIESISVWNGSTRLATVNVSSAGAWDDMDDDANHAGTADIYRVSLTGLNAVIREGNTANLTFTANAVGTIESANEAQTFRIDVPAQGIRVVDAAGINQYIGDVSDTVTLSVNAALTGDLTLTEASSNPVSGVLVADETDSSSRYPVLAFTIRNSEDVDTRVTDLTFTVATSTASGSAASDIQDIIRRATLSIGGATYEGEVNTNNTITFDDLNVTVQDNSSLTGTLSVELYGRNNHFAATGESLTFSLAASGVEAESATTGDALTSGDITGTVTGDLQTIALDAGISVAGTSNNAVLTYNSTTPSSSYGTFTLQVNVQALGEDVYIPKVVATTNGSTTYAGFVVDANMATSASGASVSTSLSTTATSQNTNFYVVRAGTTESFTIQLSVDPSTGGFYQVGLDKVRFSTTAADLNSLQTLEVDQTATQFRTSTLNIPNS